MVLISFVKNTPYRVSLELSLKITPRIRDTPEGWDNGLQK